MSLIKVEESNLTHYSIAIICFGVLKNSNYLKWVFFMTYIDWLDGEGIESIYQSIYTQLYLV